MGIFSGALSKRVDRRRLDCPPQLPCFRNLKQRAPVFSQKECFELMDLDTPSNETATSARSQYSRTQRLSTASNHTKMNGRRPNEWQLKMARMKMTGKHRFRTGKALWNVAPPPFTTSISKDEEQQNQRIQSSLQAYERRKQDILRRGYRTDFRGDAKMSRHCCSASQQQQQQQRLVAAMIQAFEAMASHQHSVPDRPTVADRTWSSLLNHRNSSRNSSAWDDVPEARARCSYLPSQYHPSQSRSSLRKDDPIAQAAVQRLLSEKKGPIDREELLRWLEEIADASTVETDTTTTSSSSSSSFTESPPHSPRHPRSRHNPDPYTSILFGTASSPNGDVSALTSSFPSWSDDSTSSSDGGGWHSPRTSVHNPHAPVDFERYVEEFAALVDAYRAEWHDEKNDDSTTGQPLAKKDVSVQHALLNKLDLPTRASEQLPLTERLKLGATTDHSGSSSSSGNRMRITGNNTTQAATTNTPPPTHHYHRTQQQQQQQYSSAGCGVPTQRGGNHPRNLLTGRTHAYDARWEQRLLL